VRLRKRNHQKNDKQCQEIIGKKIWYDQCDDDNGKNNACTVIQAGPCYVTQVRTKVKDGYDAIQLAMMTRRKSILPRPRWPFQEGRCNAQALCCGVYPFEEGHRKQFGDQVTVSEFIEGEYIDECELPRVRDFRVLYAAIISVVWVMQPMDSTTVCVHRVPSGPPPILRGI
jgi:hypothetical protein